VLAIILCALTPGIALADDGYKVAYDGGSIPDVKAGTGMKLAGRHGLRNTLQCGLTSPLYLSFLERLATLLIVELVHQSWKSACFPKL
jgi:hypothetical protein